MKKILLIAFVFFISSYLFADEKYIDAINYKKDGDFDVYILVNNKPKVEEETGENYYLKHEFRQNTKYKNDTTFSEWHLYIVGNKFKTKLITEKEGLKIKDIKYENDKVVYIKIDKTEYIVR